MSFRLPTVLALAAGLVLAVWIVRAPTLPPSHDRANPESAAGARTPATGSGASTLHAVELDYANRLPSAETLAEDLVALARDLADQEYRPAPAAVPDALTNLDFDGYRQVRFRPDRGVWRGEERFEIQLFHLGSLYARPVHIHLVERGRIVPLNYDPALFSFEGPAEALADLTPESVPGFAGFRVHYPLNAPDTQDEVAAFLGASYFRILGEGQEYGLSARGVAIDPAVQGPEEFPDFRAFWIERPDGEDELVLHALLDGPSVTGAYRMVLRPGRSTSLHVEATLFARQDVGKLGVAPFSSMFLHAPGHGPAVDDFRPRVHDSDGLQMLTGEGEWIWRPLGNGPGLHVTSLRDRAPQGFGLFQRTRTFESYLDLEARYHHRPSYWVGVLGGDWGAGGVELMEIPTDSEFNDNIAAYWVPERPFRAGEERRFSYVLETLEAVHPDVDVGHVARTLVGWDALPGESDPPPRSRRRFVVDFEGPALSTVPALRDLEARLTLSNGRAEEVMIQTLPGNSGRRVTFSLVPEETAAADMRLILMHDDVPVSETWSYVWYPSRVH